eukprot:TRINITY_DN3737_c0_g2_i2.p1 TRINITY_DN3737_c0_g2~~TRINITY_DN3737_c0_g2_i2.p1  ORF type:complete len:622 (+),score=22.69 TRINITY_DN3737_c0_g2_i2:503-2368(+)
MKHRSQQPIRAAACLAAILSLALVCGSSVTMAGASCSASKLAGYAFSQDVSGTGLLLHWNPVSSSQVDMAVEATAGSGAETGWFSIGWSGGPKMFPSDAVFGNLPGGKVAPYTMTGYDITTVTPTTKLKIGTSSLETSNGGSVIMKFSRSTGDGGSFPVDLSGTNTIIWAYSPDASKAPDYHAQFRGSASVNFGCKAGSTSGGSGSTGSTGSGSTSSGSGSTTATNTSSSATTNSTSGSSGGCTPSTLAGFHCCVQLCGDKFVLHWATNKTAVRMAAEVATTGWASVGWSPDGKMASSDAAIGNLPTGTVANGAAVSAHYMTGYGMGDVQPTTGFTMTETVVEASSNGKTIVQFTRTLTDGKVPINQNGPTTVLWAYDAAGNKALGYHGPNRGSASIDFISGSATASSSSAPSSTAYIIHGWLLTIAFGILMPAAVIISRIFLADKLQEKPPGVDPVQWEAQLARAKAWKPIAFETHKWVQITAVLLAIGGCIFAFVKSGTKGLQTLHGQIGLAVMCLCLIQPLIGHFRPNKGTPSRPTWFIFHLVVGLSILGLAWGTTFLGIQRLATMFLYNMQVYYIIFAIAIGLFFMIYVFIFAMDQAAFVLARMRSNREGGKLVEVV